MASNFMQNLHKPRKKAIALGDPLMPYEQRVERALQRILASRSWSKPQRDWLQRIANQNKAITIVDRDALDDDALLFRREGGGWPRLNKLFGGELDGCCSSSSGRCGRREVSPGLRATPFRPGRSGADRC